MLGLRKYAAALGVAVTTLAGSPVLAASVDFTSYNSWTSGTLGFGTGESAVRVRGATHQNGASLSGSYIASWSGSAGGLGVCQVLNNNYYDYYCDETHTVDSNGPDELVALRFTNGTAVQLQSITLAYVSTNDDINIYTYGDSFGAGPTSGIEDFAVDINNCLGTCTVDISNLGLLGATRFGIGVGGRGDSVKIQALSFSVLGDGNEETPPAVPLPAGLLLLGTGLAGLYAARLRQSRTASAAS